MIICRIPISKGEEKRREETVGKAVKFILQYFFFFFFSFFPSFFYVECGRIGYDGIR